MKMSDGEFEELHRRAGELGISAAQLLRDGAELGEGSGNVSAPVKAVVSGGDGESVSQRPAKASAGEDRPAGSTPAPSVDESSPAFRRKVQELKSKGYDQERAEAVARRMVG